MKSSKPRLEVVIIAIIAFNVYSCCTKKLCLGVESINEIHLLKFTPSETDSIIVKSFKKNTTYMVDSFQVKAQGRTSNDPELIIFMAKKIDLNLDYKITFSKLNKTVIISDFITKEAPCNSCFPIGHDIVTILDSYSTNGQKQTNTNLVITQ